MQTRDSTAKDWSEEEKEDLENIVGNLLVAEYQIDKLRTRLVDLILSLATQNKEKISLKLYGVDKSKGNVVTIVTTNNGEASKVKFLDSEAPYVVPLDSSAPIS
ncbi:MAG TPA: hypothetical protein VKA95_13090 [Nitrososphaeraceae archaeon]|nr:hypothetical protein [Nitrososphaeraceae archaeon]